jgi:peptide-methionine (S)-S-oxide reductase
MIIRGFGHGLWRAALAVALPVAVAAAAVSTLRAETATPLPPPAHDAPLASAPGSATAVLAGGCFWGVQAVFQHVEGVTQAVSGYSGGSAETAEYRVVGSGRTGHAESVEVTYDPSRISYGRILQIFFSVAHDPTQVDRQGPDIGPQYRSAIFAADAEQAKIAEDYVAQLNKSGAFSRRIATEITQLDRFYPAEAYHQDYATLHPESGYIVYNDLPKLENLKRLFPDVYRADPVLVSEAGKPS